MFSNQIILIVKWFVDLNHLLAAAVFVPLNDKHFLHTLKTQISRMIVTQWFCNLNYNLVRGSKQVPKADLGTLCHCNYAMFTFLVLRNSTLILHCIFTVLPEVLDSVQYIIVRYSIHKLVYLIENNFD